MERETDGNAMTKTFFRCLLVGVLFLVILAICQSSGDDPLPEPIGESDLAALSPAGRDYFGLLLNKLIGVSVAIAALDVSSLIGLFFFWNPARVLFIVSTCLLVILVPPSMSLNDPWWETLATLRDLTLPLVIMLLMLLPPVCRFFTKKR